MQIGVIAKLKIKEEFIVEVLEELKILHKSTHEHDRGCIVYDLNKDLEDEHTYIFIETWEDEESLTEHMQKEHFLTCVGNIQDKLESMEINKTTKLL